MIMNRRFWALLLVFALCVALFVGCDAPEGESSSGTEAIGGSESGESDGSFIGSDSSGESGAATETDEATEGAVSDSNETDGTTATESGSEAETSGKQTESKTEDAAVEVDSVSLDRPTLSMKVGERKSLSATVTPENADNITFIWTSSNEDVIMVSSSGSVYAVAVGHATITVTVGEKTASCQVTVTKKTSGGGSQRPEETTEGWTESDTEYPWWDENTERRTEPATEYPWWDENTERWTESATEYPWWDENTERWTESATEYPWWEETDTETNNDFESSVETAVMSHDEFDAADIDDFVVIESYVQATQAWYNNTVVAYLQGPDGAYHSYNMVCSEEDAELLVPGVKIRVSGYKSTWAGLIEIICATFTFVDGADTYIAEPVDLTDILADESNMLKHQNELAIFKDLTIENIVYQGGETGRDIYVTVGLGENSFEFIVEQYLTGPETDVYQMVENLEIGDIVDIVGFVNWFFGVNVHITGVTAK